MYGDEDNNTPNLFRSLSDFSGSGLMQCSATFSGMAQLLTEAFCHTEARKDNRRMTFFIPRWSCFITRKIRE